MGLTWVARLSRFEGSNLFNEGQYEEAVEAFTKAISIEPDEIAGYSNRCAALTKLERWEEVVIDASRCLELDPAHAISLSRKAKALFNLGCYEDAIDNAEKAAAMDPKRADAMTALNMECQAALAQSHETQSSAAVDAGVDEGPFPPDSSPQSKLTAFANLPLGAPGPTTPRPASEAVKPDPQSPETAAPWPAATVELIVGKEALEEEEEDERWHEMVELEALKAEMEAFCKNNTPEVVLKHLDDALYKFPGESEWYAIRGRVLLDLQRAGVEFEAIADFTAALDLAPSAKCCDVINAALQGRAEARTAVRRSLKEDTKAVEAKVKQYTKFGEEMAVQARKFVNVFLEHDARHREAVRARNAERQRHNNLRRGGDPAQAV